jgi:hypothetical protein
VSLKQNDLCERSGSKEEGLLKFHCIRPALMR